MSLGSRVLRFFRFILFPQAKPLPKVKPKKEKPVDKLIKKDKKKIDKMMNTLVEKDKPRDKKIERCDKAMKKKKGS